MTDCLFTIDDPDPGRRHQACDRCLTGAWASNDLLRTRGWLVFDGRSEADRDLHVRICPKCQSTKERS